MSYHKRILPSNNGSHNCQIGQNNAGRQPPGDRNGRDMSATADSENCDSESRSAEEDLPLLTLVMDENERALTADEVLIPDIKDEVIMECGFTRNLIINVGNLSLFTFDERIGALKLINEVSAKAIFVLSADGDEHNNLFSAVVDQIPDNQDLERFATCKSLALQVAAWCFPDALDGACDRIAKQMQGRGITGIRTADLVREARAIEHEMVGEHDGGDDEHDSGRVHDFLPDAPVSEAAVIPYGWTITESGVFRFDDEPHIPAPIVITGRGKDLATGVELWQIAWYRDGRWHDHVIDRADAANTRTVVDLAAYGVTVTTNNAKILVQYLADYESANLEILPVMQVSRQMGFQGKDGELGFLWGRTLITADWVPNNEPCGVQDTNHGLVAPVVFRGADEGDEQLADGFHSAGSYEGWKDAILHLRDYPKALLGLYTAFVSVMLFILKSPNFVLDFAGITSCGKTIGLRIDASVWGNPAMDTGKAAALASWKSTAVWRERASAVLNHLPLILDDTKVASSPEAIAETIYSITQGRGKGRGTVKGTAKSDTFQTVLLSSGEQPLTGFTNDGGTQVRVLTFWGSPFEATDMETGQLVRKIDKQILLNYGHAGPQFVQYLLRNRSQWEIIRKFYEKRLERYVEWVDGNSLAGRMAAHFAAIATTAVLVDSVLYLPWNGEECVDVLFDELVGQVGDLPSAALRHVMDWAYSHQTEFCSGAASSQQPREFAGRWDRVEQNFGHHEEAEQDWEWIGFIPSLLQDILKKGGYDPNSIIRTWKDRGWLRCTIENNGTVRSQFRTRVGEKSIFVVAITAEAIQEVENE